MMKTLFNETSIEVHIENLIQSAQKTINRLTLNQFEGKSTKAVIDGLCQSYLMQPLQLKDRLPKQPEVVGDRKIWLIEVPFDGSHVLFDIKPTYSYSHLPVIYRLDSLRSKLEFLYETSPDGDLSHFVKSNQEMIDRINLLLDNLNADIAKNNPAIRAAIVQAVHIKRTSLDRDKEIMDSFKN